MGYDELLLDLGRLDGRLTHSPAKDIWMIRARLEGAASSACNAGSPTTAEDIEAWVAGSAKPPRAIQGINDPVSVAVIVHYMFATLGDQHSVAGKAVVRLIRLIFNPQAEAQEWAECDLLHFGPLWRALMQLARAPDLEPSLASVAERMATMARLVSKSQHHVTTIATDYEGKQFAFEIDDRKAWLVYLLVPCVLQSANMTANIIPSLVPRDKYLCLDIKHARAVLEQCIERETKRGLKKLATAERQIKTLNAKAKRTNRSRLALTAALCLALPSLSRKKLAGAIGVTPAGAGYLLNQLKGVTV